MTTTTRRISAKKLRKVVSPSFSASNNENKTKAKMHDNSQQVFVLSGCIMSDIVFGGRSDIWSTNLGCASVGTPDIRPPPQTISYTSQHPIMKIKTKTKKHDNSQQVFVLSGCIMSDIVFGGRSDIWSTNLGCASVGTPDIRPSPQTISYT